MSKTLVVALLATLLVASNAAAVTSKLSHVQEKRADELKNEKWGSIIFDLAELHMMSEGPLDELVNALQELINDLGDRIDELDEEYNERSLENQSEVTRLSSEISSAQIDVSSTNDILNNILYPTRVELQDKIEQLNENINENNRYIERITFEREEANEQYNQRVTEHNEALAAVDECLELISELTGGIVSFAQTKQIKNGLDKINKHLSKMTVDDAMIKALVALASEEFADMGAIQKVANTLKDIKGEIQNALQTEHDDEARQVAAYEEDKAEKNDENREFARNINIATGELNGTENRIAQKEAFLSVRSSDLSNFQTDLDQENESFTTATENYQDIRTQLERETAVANDALALVSNAGFASYISNRV